MNEPSPAQIQFLKSKKREKQFVFTARCLIFIVFLVSWELSARTGVIDSFIFSSPSQIVLSFRHMWLEEGLFTHIAVTLKETLLSFFFVVIFGTGAAVLMWGMPKLSKICPCPASYCVARSKSAHHCGCRYVRCHFRHSNQSVYRFSGS